MVSSSVCERVLSRALSRGGTFAEIFIEDSRNFSMSLRDGRIENAALSRPYGAGVRVYDGLRSIYVYTCDVSETGLLRAADRAAAAVTDTPKAAGDVRLAAPIRISTRSKRRSSPWRPRAARTSCVRRIKPPAPFSQASCRFPPG